VKDILGALDLGAEGIIVPMVNSSLEAQKAVNSLHYPPKGIRGLSQGRAGKYGIGISLQEHIEKTKDLILIVQIESKKAVSNIDEISSIQGIDVVFVGPSDLSSDYNLISQTKDKKFQKIISNLGTHITNANKIAGIFSKDADLGKKYINEGYSFLLTNVFSCITSGFENFKSSLYNN